MTIQPLNWSISEWSFKSNGHFWWSCPRAISWVFMKVIWFLHTSYVTVSLYLLFSPPAVLPFHLSFLLLFVLLHVTNLYTFFETWLNNSLGNFSRSLETGPVYIKALKLTFPIVSVHIFRFGSYNIHLLLLWTISP